MIEKFEDVRLLNAFPNVVRGNGLITGVGVIVIYGGESALTTPTPTNAHIVVTIFSIYFFKSGIFQLQSSPELYEVVLDASFHNLTIINISHNIINTHTNAVIHTI